MLLHRWIFIFILAAGPLFGQTNESDDLGLDLSLNFASRYIQAKPTQNGSDPAIQPSITYSPPWLSGFTTDVFSSFGIRSKRVDGPRHGELDEVDITLAYRTPIYRNIIFLSGDFEVFNNISDVASVNQTNNQDFQLGMKVQIYP